MAELACSELIDEIQARVGRPGTADLIDVTWLTRRINEAQRIIVEAVPLITSLTFRNVESYDTTGTITYGISDITVGDSTTLNRPCRITGVWYLDGNESRQLDFLPIDEFDAAFPDPTHSDSHFDKPRYWTVRGNSNVEVVPYCASGYWDNDLGFNGDFYPADFTTDSTETTDITRADEGLILYGVWKSWVAIGRSNPAVGAEIADAKRAWSNPYPSVGEKLGWLEEFGDYFDQAPGWYTNYYGFAGD